MNTRKGPSARSRAVSSTCLPSGSQRASAIAAIGRLSVRDWPAPVGTRISCEGSFVEASKAQFPSAVSDSA